MKTFLRLTYILSASLLLGCMKEDYSLCTETNDGQLVLSFAYLDENGKDAFDECIRQVDVVLFDESYNFYSHLTVEEESLADTKNITMDLPAGDYYLVSWGNMSLQTTLTDMSNSTQLINAQLNHHNTASIDPLYYAPDQRSNSATTENLDEYKISVIASTETEHTAYFMSAYHTINVFVKGLADPGTDMFNAISAYVENIPSWYDFMLGYPEKDELMQLTQVTSEVTQEGKSWAHAGFNVPHFQNENDLVISIQAEYAGTAISDEVALSEFLKKEGITIKDGEGKAINIEFEYRDGNLTGINLIPWESNKVGPSFD